MATEIIVPSSLGQEFNFQLPASLPAAKTYEFRTQPVNAQSFDKAGAVIQFDLPSGKRGMYLDPTTTYVRFRATYTQSGAAGTDLHVLLGSAYSYFNRQEVYGNNSLLLETINELGVLASLLINTQLNGADKIGNAPAFGFTDSPVNIFSNIGHLINSTAPNQLVFEYAIPIIGILGSGTDKMIPVGLFNSLRFELTLDDYTAFTNYNSPATLTQNKLASMTITDVEFVGQIVELDNDSQSLIDAQNPGKIHIRTQSYRTSSNNISATTYGLTDILIGTRVSSLKSMYISCAPADAAELKFASVSPNAVQGTCLVLAGQQLPQRTVNPTNRPADMWMELQKAMGSLSYTQYNGFTNKASYYTSSTATGLCVAYNIDELKLYSNPSMHFMGFNTKKS